MKSGISTFLAVLSETTYKIMARKGLRVVVRSSLFFLP
jgi:hypothetical protein